MTKKIQKQLSPKAEDLSSKEEEARLSISTEQRAHEVALEFALLCTRFTIEDNFKRDPEYQLVCPITPPDDASLEMKMKFIKNPQEDRSKLVKQRDIFLNTYLAVYDEVFKGIWISPRTLAATITEKLP